MSKLFLILGAVFLAYFLGIILYAGIHASFVWFWLVLGAVCWFAAAVCRVASLQAVFLRLPFGIRIFAGVILGLGCLVFLGAEGLILSGMRSGAEQPVDCLIVLGAQVKGTRVSRALKQRLDTAVLYLEEHEDTVVVVSGGQGPGEDISEAQAMSDYLENAGIFAGRILKEDKSVNTEQNIRFSRALMPEDAVSVGIVSNDFHVFRAVHIARAQGVSAAGIPAPTEIFMRPHYMTREAFALVKDFLKGNAVF